MNDKTILIIDDQRSQLRLLKQLVEKCGWRAVTVDSAEEAQLIMDWGHEFCAVITDLVMPWLNGVAFCKHAKKKFPEIKIYALSGNPDVFDYDELKNAGFDGFYFKPISMRIIVNILSAIEGDRTG